MRSRQWLRGAQSRRSVLIRLVTLAVVVAVATAPVGVVAAQSDTTQADDTYAVAQGDRCFTVTPFTGNESVKTVYDYRTPYPENPYSNTTGDTYSSHGTTAIQQINRSALFLYQQQGASGNETLSLVMVHGAYDQYPSAGGAATFNITGLPEDGRWAVQDDQYDNGDNYDNWSIQPGRTTVDWTWGPQRTDGGAFAGLGDEFTVTIDPAFNQNAPLYGEYYNGSLEGWDAVSDEPADSANATFNRTALGGVEPVTISTQSCAALTNGTNGATQDDTTQDDTTNETTEEDTANETTEDETNETTQDDTTNETTEEDTANETTQSDEQTGDSTIDDEEVLPTSQAQATGDGAVGQRQSVSLSQAALDGDEIDDEWLDAWLDDVTPETDVSVADVDNSAADALIERIESGEPIDEEWLDQWIEDALGQQVSVAD